MKKSELFIQNWLKKNQPKSIDDLVKHVFPEDFDRILLLITSKGDVFTELMFFCEKILQFYGTERKIK